MRFQLKATNADAVVSLGSKFANKLQNSVFCLPEAMLSPSFL
jgi:hypothetical protein